MLAKGNSWIPLYLIAIFFWGGICVLFWKYDKLLTKAIGIFGNFVPDKNTYVQGQIRWGRFASSIVLIFLIWRFLYQLFN